MAKIGYARVSTNDQHPEAQADRLRADGCERIFTDKGVSGRKASRPEWDKCLDHLREGDTLVVVRMDRMGRSVLNLINVVNELHARGTDIRAIDQGIDTTTAAGKFFFHVLAALAEMEADINHERTMDGLAAARARGRKGGRRPKLTPAQADQARKLYAAREMTVAEIGELFGITRESVYRYVNPPKKVSDQQEQAKG
jgi:DNA invertase Pin-like site-specific DNA recombinase